MERAELGRRGPAPWRPRGQACYSARRSAGTRTAPVAWGPGPRATPNQRPETAGAAAASRPSLPYHPSHFHWTSGPWAPAPTGFRKPSPPSPAAGPCASLSLEPPSPPQD
ncbi:hypothetical protein H8959_015507 [Pygathrix nigripes]